MTDLDFPFEPDWVSPPGDTLRLIIEERSLNEDDLAQQLDLHSSQLADLLEGTLAIDTALAQKLEEKVGGQVWLWLARENDYRAECARLGITPGVAAK